MYILLYISTTLKNLVKNLVTLGSNISQAHEFQDLLEDIMTKVMLL